MTSTVLDVGLCLLLVSASVHAVTTADVTTDRSPDRDADVVATTTATVEYEFRAVGPDGAKTVAVDRRAHGTLAELLGTAAVAGTAVGKIRLSPGAEPFADAVANATRERTGPRTRIDAIWEPYAGASVRGAVAAGERPPPGADVRAVIVSVPSGASTTRDPAEAAAAGGFDALGRVVSDAIADVTVADPPTAGSTSDGGGTATNVGGRATGDATRAYHSGRTHRLGRAHGIEVDAASGGNGVRSDQSREQLLQALTQRVTAELRAEYDDPGAAAADVRVERVRIVVRTW